MDTPDELEKFLSLLPGSVRDGLYPVSNDDFEYPYMLHVSIDRKIKEFVPSVTRRTANNEDRTVARISTAPTLLGCFAGYMKGVSDSLYPDNGWRGGWYVYALPFKQALVPNKKLLFDQKTTDEHWLVTYNQETINYPAEIIAKCFYKEVVALPRTKGWPAYRVKLAIEVLGDKPVRYCKGVVLTKGTWLIEGPDPASPGITWKSRNEYQITELDPKTYKESKKLSADLLSHSPLPPSYLWSES